VLTALAGRAIGVDAQVFFVDVDFYGIVNFRGDENRGERSVSAFVGVERRNPHQTMHTGFGLEVAVSVFALHDCGHVLYAGLFSVLNVEQVPVEAIALGVTLIHAHQHCGPVLRFRAARTGIYGDNGIGSIGRPGKHLLELLVFDHQRQLVQHIFCVFFKRRIVFFASQFEQRTQVFFQLTHLFESADLFFKTLFVSQNFFGALTIFPDVLGSRFAR